MAAEISESLQRELRIVELEAEFRENEPLGKPRKAWQVLIGAGLLLLGALAGWIMDSLALTSFCLMMLVLQLISHEASKRASKLYESGSEVIEYYKSKSRTGAQAHHPE
jgi:hypothetical protein